MTQPIEPLVSILIPCYNAEKWLAETLESALAQTWQNIEIIVVDDGSTDASLTVAQQFASSRVCVISQPNQGAAAARNRALRQAQGDFIQYLDADDLLASDKLEQQLQMLNGQPNVIASATWGRFSDRPQTASFKPDKLWQDLSPVDWIITALEQNTMMNPACWLIPRTIADKAGKWNEALSLNDDGEYFWRVILRSEGVRFCPNATVYYRSNVPGSLSSLTSETGWRSLYASLESIDQELLQVENTERTRHAIATALQRFIYQTYPAVPDLRKQAATTIKTLGGSDLPPQGGKQFRQLSRLMGWKLAKRLQVWVHSYGSAQSTTRPKMGVS